MHIPKISIITPSYNQGKFLEETILSVLTQGYPNLEYIIIDGGSNDNSIDIIKKYEDRLAFWVSEKDEGQTEAINKGFRRATGDIVTWLCSDDTYYPGTLQFVSDFFLHNPDVDVVYGNAASIDENGVIFRSPRTLDFTLLGLWIGENPIPQPSSFMRSRILEKVGYLNESLYYCMDKEFFLRMAFAGSKIQHVNKILATYRFHEESKTVSAMYSEKEKMDELIRISKMYDLGYSQAGMAIAKLYFRIKKRLFNIDRYWLYRKNYLERMRKKRVY